MSLWSWNYNHCLASNSSTGLPILRMGHDWMSMDKDPRGDKHYGAYFDIRLLNPYTPSNCKSTNKSVYRRHEREEVLL